ncbi:L10-interacting MYB domain-containing protein [Linum grandiflorum]
MDNDCVEIDGKDVWPEIVELFLIDLMVEEVKKGNRTTTTFSKSGWSNIRKSLNEKFTTKEYADDQLKNKYNQFRQRHRMFKGLINETGMGYTRETGKLEAPDEIWDKKKKIPCRTSKLQGHDWVRELLEGNPTRIYESLRMDKRTFRIFCEDLKQHGGLKATKNIGVEEQVAIFLKIVGTVYTTREGAERFQHSTATISKYFGIVLKAVNRFASTIISHPNLNEVPPHILGNSKFYPYFKVT